MDPAARKWTIHERVVAIFQGKKPDRLPFIDRLELWYNSHIRAGTLPEEFREMPLTEIHRAVGIGQQKFVPPYGMRLRGLEMITRFEGEVRYHEADPVVTYFPDVYDLAPADKVGITVTEFITPVGKLSIRHELRAPMVAAGTRPYPMEHLIKEEGDYRTAEWILERAEFVPQFERYRAEAERIGDVGFAVPCLRRIPFQQLLLEYLGETPLFYALYDNPQAVQRLLDLLGQRTVEVLDRLADLDVPYVEFPDNMDGQMTNPRLFAKYCLPAYQRYAEIVHGQGKKMGSHTDGNVKPLLGLLAQSGLDVCESFSPAPLTECTFEEAWRAWENGPVIWGGIPSPILEPRTSAAEFEDYVQRVLQTVGDRPIILGVGDMVLGNNLIERVQYIADAVENYVPSPSGKGSG